MAWIRTIREDEGGGPAGRFVRTGGRSRPRPGGQRMQIHSLNPAAMAGHLAV
ncbi:MAG: hypothetical protein Ct9H300mP12_10330 [Acidimicrobiales bacterium]|nr:MAG: hypothetical protein Ct9H300mP12_10330 [Acidimicrobiales bacterium]